MRAGSSTAVASAAALFGAAGMALAAFDCTGANDVRAGDAAVVGDTASSDDASPDTMGDAGTGLCTSHDAWTDCSAPATTSDWPGWQRVPGFDSCCVVDRPVDLDASVAPLTWVPCADASGCSELANVPPRSGRPFIRHQHVGHDGQGQPKTLEIRWALESDVAIAEEVVFDLPSGRPLAALRSNGLYGCFSILDVGVTRGGILTQSDSTQNIMVARGTLAELTTSPRFQCVFSTSPGGAYPGETRSSDTTYAFDVAGSGVIMRSVPGSDAFVYSDTNNHTIYLNMDFVEGDDVFARESTRWRQEYLVLPDGGAMLYRGVPGRHASAFATDGNTMFWVESYGISDAGLPTTSEVWAAPYIPGQPVSDAGARMIGTVPPGWIPRDATAFGGVYAVGVPTGLTVIRLSDGASRTVSSGDSNVAFTGPVLVTATEAWSVMTMIVGPSNFALRRYDLGNW